MQKLSINAKQILHFLHRAEKLKNELRHSWTSSGRNESVAEHSWRLTLMVVICSPFLSKDIDMMKAIKMAAIHDIGEIIVGDCHAFKIESDQTLSENRKQKEKEAVLEIAGSIGDSGQELIANWLEFEKNSSKEAQIVNFLDKLEVCIQHNESSLDTWTQDELTGIKDFYSKLQINEEFLTELKNLVVFETEMKLEKLFL